jgi:hypothetical protein
MAVTRHAMTNAHNGISSDILCRDICLEASISVLKDTIEVMRRRAIGLRSIRRSHQDVFNPKSREVLDHQVAVVAAGIVARHAAHYLIAQIEIEFLRGLVRCSHFEPHSRNSSVEKPLLDCVHQSAAMPTAAMCGINSQSDYVARAVRLDHPDDESDHLVSRQDRFEADRLSVRQQVTYRFAVVSLSVNETLLIEPPALVEVGLSHDQYHWLSHSCHQCSAPIAFAFPSSRPHRRVQATNRLPVMLKIETSIFQYMAIKSHSLYVNTLFLAY